MTANASQLLDPDTYLRSHGKGFLRPRLALSFRSAYATLDPNRHPPPLRNRSSAIYTEEATLGQNPREPSIDARCQLADEQLIIVPHIVPRPQGTLCHGSKGWKHARRTGEPWEGTTKPDDGPIGHGWHDGCDEGERGDDG